MVKSKKNTALRIILFTVLLLICGAGIFALWLSAGYKRILKERIPLMIVKSSDSIYHISFSDISVNVFRHHVTITNVNLQPDTNQVNILRQRNHYSPNTVSTFFAPKIEAYGMNWDKILSNKSLDCKNIIIYNAVWFMQTIKHHPDLSTVEEKQEPSLINRFTAARFDLINPSYKYHYVGDKNNYIMSLKGGKAVVNDWAIDRDITKDTSTILYGRNGIITPDSFIFQQDGRRYSTQSPHIEFVTSPNSVTLKNVRINQMTDKEEKSGNILEVYNFNFPAIELVDFNWKKLLNLNVLATTNMNASAPYIDVRYVRDYFPPGKNRLGRYPQQIIHEAIKTNIRVLHIKNGKIKYTEPTQKGKEGTVEFNDINGSFANITNIDSLIANNKTCIVKLHGMYMHKSEVSATFDLSLADPKGHFTVDGFVNNLDGDDVSKQAAAFTIAEVTSFHLSHMDMHIEGNEAHSTGNFTMLYQDLKISLFKFKSDERKKPHGPFAFLADATIIYPSNPMPGKDIRKASTSFVRDTTKGFIGTIWQNMYSGAQKTAVRTDAVLDVTNAEASKEDKPKKKGFFKKLFGKKDKQ